MYFNYYSDRLKKFSRLSEEQFLPYNSQFIVVSENKETYKNIA